MVSAGSRPLYPYGKAVLAGQLEPGSSLGLYKIKEVLVVSLLGHLYRTATNEGDRRLLWVFPEGLLKDKTFATKLKQTVETLEDVSHASLLPVEDLTTIQGKLVLIFPDPGGSTLAQYLAQREGEANTVEEVKFFLAQAGSAIEAANSKGIHHYQLTPDMLLVAEDGRLLVYGFGWLQSINRVRFEQFVSHAVIPLTTEEESGPQHFTCLDVLSPEWRNEEPVDVRGDLFSLGLLAYYLLTGKRAVRDWTPPTEARPGLKTGWDYFLSTCLEPHPDDRFPSPAAFLKALETVEEKKVSPTGDESKLGRRLEVIPLPKQITSGRSQKMLLRIRLAVLGVFGLVVVGLGQVAFSILFTEDTGPVAQQVSAEQADLSLTINPTTARVRVLGEGGSSYVITNGNLHLRLASGRHRLLVDAPFHRQQAFTYDSQGGPKTQRINLPLAWATLVLTGPSGTRLSTVDEAGLESFVDSIPESGELRIEQRLLAQEYTFVASLTGHEPQTFAAVTLSESESTALEAELVPIPPILEVRSEPAGAELWINGEVVAQTPATLEGLAHDEETQVELRMEGLRPASRTLTLSPGERRLLDFGNLQVRSGQVDLTVQQAGDLFPAEMVEDLTLEINDTPYPGNARLSLSLREGRYQVTARHPQFFPHTQEVVVTDAAALAITLDLQPRPGRLQLDIPADSTVRFFVNRVPVNSAEDGAYELPANERVAVQVAVRDYFTVSGEFQLSAHQTEQWTPPLRRIPGPELGEAYDIPYQPLALVWVEPGRFSMGSPLEEQLRRPNEDARTEVILSQGFWIARTETTQAAYTRLMRTNPSEFKDPQKPVENLTWREAVTFVERLNQIEAAAERLPAGYAYRLPTEAEWEYAARAATRTPFSFGAVATPAAGNFSGFYPPDYTGIVAENREGYGTQVVGQYSANPWGLYDMHGNVAEMTLTPFRDRHPGGTVRHRVPAANAQAHAVRGGSWEGAAHRARSGARDRQSDNLRSSAVGFRIVLAPRE